MKIGSKAFLVAAPVASVMIGCFASAAHGGVIDIANNSFESPTVAPFPALLFAPPWNLSGLGTVYEPGGPGTGTVAAGVGIFTNPSPTSGGHLNYPAANGNQLAYLFNNNGNSISQGLVNPSNTSQATTFAAGQTYTLTVGAANAQAVPGAGSKLYVDLYYLTGSTQHNVAETILDPSQLNTTNVVDFSTTPTAGDAAAGQQIYVGFFASGTGGGEFDIDNARLTAAPSIPEPASIGLLGIGAAALLRRRRST